MAATAHFDTNSCYHIFNTAIGDLILICRSNPFVLEQVLLPGCRDAQVLQQQLPPAPLSRRLVRIADGLRAYGCGAPLAVPWDCISLERFTPLQQQVLRAVAAIPYGQVSTYREIGAAVGRSRAARFVGTTMARNPYPLLIPCHRVVRSDRRIGQFSSGPDLKRRLLALENCPAARYS